MMTKLISMYSFAYANARVRTMKSRLISRKDLENFSKEGYYDILYRLEKNNYPALKDEVKDDFSHPTVERGLTDLHVKRLRKVTSMAPSSVQKFFKTYSMKFDLYNIILLLGHMKDRTPISTIAGLVHTAPTTLPTDGVVNEEVVLKLITQSGFKVEDVQADQASLVSMLTEQYFNKLRHSTTDGNCLALAKLLIDVANLTAKLKGGKQFIAGGKLGVELDNAKVSVLIEKLFPSESAVSESSAHEQAKAIRRGLSAWGKHQFGKQPLSSASLVGYVVLLEEEVDTVKKILTLAHHKATPDEIIEVIA